MKPGAEILGMPVVTAEEERIGTVTDLLFDENCTQVLGLVVQTGFVIRKRRVLSFSDVRAIGPGAVAVDGGGSPLRPFRADEAADLQSGRYSIQGKPVVSPQGRFVGAVADVLVDEYTGSVVGFEIAKPAPPGAPWQRIGLPADLTTIIAGHAGERS